MSVREILETIESVSSSPKKAVAEYTEKTGKKAIGCFAAYCPEELVHAAGLLPVGLWGGAVELNRVRAALPPFACSVMQSVKEFELGGAYDMLAAVIVPTLCDTLKSMGQKWSREAVPCIQFVHPHNRKTSEARTYLAREYGSVCRRIEQAAGVKISEEALHESIEIYNIHSRVMRVFSEVAAQYPDAIDPVARHGVYKSAFFMRKEEHTELVRRLIASLMELPVKTWTGKKVIVSGILLEPVSVLEVFRDLRIAIVEDDLAQESRQYRVDIPAGKDPLDRLARKWLNQYGCSLAYDRDKFRADMLCEMRARQGADGVIAAMMKFCDPEEFDYPIIKKTMDKNRIPLLQIEVDQQVQSVAQLRTRLQGFVEMLEAGEPVEARI